MPAASSSSSPIRPVLAQLGTAVDRHRLTALTCSAGWRSVRGQHDDRYGRPAAQPRDHLDAVEVGQVQVQNNHIRLTVNRSTQRSSTILRHQYLITPRNQVNTQRTLGPWIIIGHEHRGGHTPGRRRHIQVFRPDDPPEVGCRPWPSRPSLRRPPAPRRRDSATRKTNARTTNTPISTTVNPRSLIAGKALLHAPSARN